MRLTLQQLADMAKGLGASEAGAVLGVDKYTSRIKVYYRKVEAARLPTVEETDAAYWGHKREALVADEYSFRTGYSVKAQSETLWSARYPWMYCHLDYIAPNENINIECKTAGFHVGKDWGEPGTDQVPDRVKTQVMHQMIVSGIRITDIPVLINGNDFRIYTVHYDDDLAKIIIEKEREFWHEHVLKKIPPEPEELGDLDLLYPVDDGSTVIADDNSHHAVYRRIELDSSIKSMKEENERLDMMIKGAMGDATTLTTEYGTVIASWKTQKTRRLDQKRIKKEEPELAKEFTVTTQSRVLRIKK